MSDLPAASVVIPTYNRRDLLRRSVAAALAQTVPTEVIVVDDGSTDGTPEMVRAEFPTVRFEQLPDGPRGPARLRNRGTAMATAGVVFPIDDDAVFDSPRTVEQTLAEFDHPRVGAVGIPFINVNGDRRLQQAAPAGAAGVAVVQAYVGAAHALRRDLFLGLGGYREQLFYMGEEGDFCIRMLDAGHVVRPGRADPVHHQESPSRNRFRADFYGRRNDVLFAVHNVPMPYLPPHLLATTANGLRFGLGVARPGNMIRGLASGWASIPREWRNRRAVRPSTYRLFRRLRTVNSLPLTEVEPLLPPLPADPDRTCDRRADA
jgi:glycosyltransferase involved in cell wall biosynthesis